MTQTDQPLPKGGPIGQAGLALDPEAVTALKVSMAVRHLSRQALAEAAHVSPMTVTNVLQGKRVRVQVLVAIANALAAIRPDPSVKALIRGDTD